jgi:4-alpha-glucanotransferase
MAAYWTPAQKNWKSLIDALLQSSSSASPFGLDELADGLSDISASLDVQQALLHIEAIYQLASELEHTNDPLYARVSRFRKLFESSSF